MTAPRAITTHWSGGTGQADITLPTCLAGDLLVILVGGGNQVTATPSGWDAYTSLTGQEAQGKRFAKVADGSESGGAVSIFFDGNDQRYVVALAVRDWDDHDLNDYERIGTAGGTYPAGDHTWTADTYQGDLVVTFSFARNADTPPTMSRGVLWESQASDGSSAALYLESAPTYEVGADYAITYPERSGHVSYSMAVWGLTWTGFEQGPDFEVVQNQLSIEVNDTMYDAGYESRFDGTYPDIDQSTFLDSQAAQVFVGASSVVPAQWEHDRYSDIFGPEKQRSWNTRIRHLLYAAQLTETDLGVPVTGDEPPDWFGDVEYETDSRAVEVWSEATVGDRGYDTTTGVTLDLLSGSFSTVMVPGSGIDWNPPDMIPVADWDRTHQASPIIQLRPGVLSTSSEDVTIDLTAGLDPAARARVAVVVFVTGPDGSGIPTIDLRSYTFEGLAEFGAGYSFLGVGESDDGGLHWVVRPGRARYEVRRGPVVDIIPTVVRYLRNYPRDDAYGFGNVSRNYPPPRRLRNYGRQP